MGKETSQLVTDTSLLKESNPDSKASFLFRRAMLGASIGETIVTSYRNSEIENVGNYEACRKSLCFALCRAHVLHNEKIRADLIIKRWSQLRRFSRLELSPLSLVAIRAIYDLFFQRSQPAPILSKISDLLLNSEWGKGILESDLLELYPSIKDLLPILSGPYDSRISGLTSIIGAIQSNTRGQQTDEIAIAYFVNSILPGSYRHYGILKKLINFYPSALVWYGFFASISDLETQSSMFSNLILKLDRDLLDPFSLEQRPKSDISFEELEALARVNFDLQMLNSILSDNILVSLVPGVDIYVTIGNEKEMSKWSKNRELEYEEMNNKVAKLLEEALLNLRKIALPPTRPASPNRTNSSSTTPVSARRSRPQRSK